MAPAEPRFPAPDPRDVDPRAVRRAFGRAAATYDAAAVLQREVGARMASRLDYIRIAPSTILDAGCGTGGAVGELAARYAGARVIALDMALPMVAAARERARGARSLLRRLLPEGLGRSPAAPLFICGDCNALPLPGVAVDLIWSSLALQWVNDLPRAFARADGHTHTNRFIDMHDIGDMLVGAGFADPVMDMEQLTLTYTDAGSLMRELKQVGASNATRGRPHGLMGRGRWQRALAALEAMRNEGRIPATYEVVYGHAWKGEPKFSADGHPIVQLKRPGR